MSNNGTFQINRLSDEEIETLQVDSALRLLAQHTNHIIQINQEIADALQEKLIAECRLNKLKSTKSTLTQNMRALECIARSA